MLDYSAACSRLRVQKLQVEIRGEDASVPAGGGTLARKPPTSPAGGSLQ